MRHWLLIAAVLLLCLAGTQTAFAQTAPLDPAAIDAGVAGSLGQYAAGASYPYAGDCQVAESVAGVVCSLVFQQADGSLLAGFYLVGDDGTLAPEPFDALSFSLATPVAQRSAVAPAPPSRLLIPRIGVNAAVVTLGLIPGTNTLDAPRNKDDAGYYDFTPVPGYGGNTVIAGHVDWYTGETGVFWNLRQLARGDAVQLLMPDGSGFNYQVTDMQVYDDNAAPIDAIIGETDREVLTLITCDGVFDPGVADYNQRRIVRAVRLYP